MGTTPLAGLEIPDLSDAANAPAFMSTFGAAAEKLMVMRFASAAARDAAIVSPEEGMLVCTTDAERWWLYDGTGWIIMAEPALTVTPTLTGMAIGTGGSASNVLTYHRSDGHLDFEWTAVFGTSGTTFPTNPTFSLPVAMANAEAAFPALLVGAGGRYQGLAVTATTSTLALATFAALPAGLTTTTPFTWAAGDTISVRGRYRMTTRYS